MAQHVRGHSLPGPYLKGKLQYIVDEANKLNDVTFDAVTPGRSCIVAITGADGGNLTGGDISYYLTQWVRNSGLDPDTAIVTRDGLVTVGPLSNGNQILLKKYSYQGGGAGLAVLRVHRDAGGTCRTGRARGG